VLAVSPSTPSLRQIPNARFSEPATGGSCATAARGGRNLAHLVAEAWNEDPSLAVAHFADELGRHHRGIGYPVAVMSVVERVQRPVHRRFQVDGAARAEQKGGDQSLAVPWRQRMGGPEQKREQEREHEAVIGADHQPQQVETILIVRRGHFCRRIGGSLSLRQRFGSENDAKLAQPFVVLARFLLTGHAVLPYLFPIAGVSMVLVLLLNTELAMASTVFLAVFCAYFADQSLSLTTMFLVSGLIGVLLAERAQSTVAFLWSAAAIGVAGSLCAVSWRLLTPPVDALGIAQRVGFAFGNGILSAGIAFIGIIFPVLL